MFSISLFKCCPCFISLQECYRYIFFLHLLQHRLYFSQGWTLRFMSKINMSQLWKGETFKGPFMEEHTVSVCLATSASGSFRVSQALRERWDIGGSDLQLLRPSVGERQWRVHKVSSLNLWCSLNAVYGTVEISRMSDTNHFITLTFLSSVKKQKWKKVDFWFFTKIVTDRS